MHSEGNPSGPFVLGLRGLQLRGEWRASRLMWGAARASCVLRSVPKSKLMAGPAMSGLRRITAGGGIMVRFARLERDSCCGMHSEGNPSGPFVLGLQGLELMGIKCASRLASYRSGLRCMWRFSPYDCSGRGPVWGRGRCLWVKYERCVNESVDGDVSR